MSTGQQPFDGSSGGGYEWVAQVRAELLQLVTTMQRIAMDVESSTHRSALGELRTRVESDEFVVLVAGEFKTGKSTTINAVLGDKVLPAYATPTTAVLSVVRFAEQPAARLYELDPASSSGLSSASKPIAVEELAQYVTIDEANPDQPSPWGLAEIDWPLELCRNGVTVVDSPGLNEHPERSKVTMGYVGRADAIVFVSDATRVLSASERDFLNLHIRAQGHEDMFFVCNRINQVDDDPVEQERVRTRVHRILSTDWDAGPQRVFFVNSKAALIGRQTGNTDLVAESGIPPFEGELERFLSHQRARVKIVPPARQLQRIVSDTRETIDRQVSMLDQSVEALRDKYERAQTPLRQLEQERRLIVRLVEEHLNAARFEAEDSARRSLAEAAGSCVGWARNAEREHKITANPFTAKAQVEAASKEIAERLGVKLQEHFALWQRDTLMPLLQRHLEALEADIDNSLRHFIAGIDDVKLSFAMSEQAGVGAPQPSTLERTISGVVGLALFSPGLGLVGARLGFKQVLLGAGPQLATAILATLIGLGPVSLAVLLAGAAFVQFVYGLKRANELLATKAAERIADEIRTSAPEHVSKIGGEVQAVLDKIRIVIDEDLGGRLSGVREEVEVVMRELSLGRGNATQMKERLATHRSTLTELDAASVDIITQFAAIQ